MMQSRRYNILYLDSGNGIGGGQRSLLLLLKHLDSTRFRAFVGCSGDSMLAAEARKAGHTIVPLALPKQHHKRDKVRRFSLGDLRRDLRQLRAISQLSAALSGHRIDLIHANSLAAGLIGGVVAKFSGVPIIMHKRYATSYGILDRLGEKLVNKLILVSEATRWDFARRSKQTLVYNGVELAAFRVPLQEVEAIRAGLNLSRESLLVGIATRITPEKGIHLLIEAMAQLRNFPWIKLLVVGGSYFPKDAAYLDHLKAQASKAGVADAVIFTGFLADPRSVISLLDIVLLASTIPEACPRTIIEAMAAAKPVIATPLGGTKELITPDAGVLVPPESPSAFAAAIAQLAGNSELRDRMGKAGLSRAAQLFSAERNARLTEALYWHLLNGR